MLPERATHDMRPGHGHANEPYYVDGKCPCGEGPGCTNVGGLKRRCLAKSRRNPTGKCHSDKCMANGRCRMHFGNARSGIAHPNYKHGREVNARHRWAASLPKGLGERFDQALADPTLASLRQAIALNDGMLTAYTALLKDTGRPLTALQTKRVHDMLDMQRRLARDEARRLRDLQTMLSGDQFRIFVGVIIALFIEFVPDLKARAIIHRRIQQALLAAGRQEPIDVEGRTE